MDQQVAELQRALKDSGDPQLAEIAEYGVNGVTGGYKVRLAAALTDLVRTTEDKRQAATARAAGVVGAFRTHISTHPPVALCEDNPFEVPMPIRATLLPALDAIEAALSDA